MRLTTAAFVAALFVALLPAAQKITSVEGITEYRIDNGLRVLLFPDPSKQTVTVNITYLVGSRHENYGETGPPWRPGGVNHRHWLRPRYISI